VRRIAGAIALLISLAAIAALAWVMYAIPGAITDGSAPPVRAAGPPSEGDPLLIAIDAGENARTIGEKLEEQGVIESARHFEVLVGLTGVQDSLEAGEYEFDRGIPVLEAVNRIAEGRTASRRVVIPEGLRAEEIGAILEGEDIVNQADFVAALDRTLYTQPFLSQVQSSRLDGFLFPAGYEFRRDVTAQEVVDAMLTAFQTNVADVIQLEGQPMTLEDAVNLAAIIEREATEPSEHPIIASVYLNRLRDGIALQADPTTQYAVAFSLESVATYGYWKEELTVDDLALDSPYNTYVYAGLPPTPIANPGFDTIQAVIRPAQTDYFYFVAKGDGFHAFAETLEEHFANVELYQ
jgi:UPF0755 protein